MAKEKTPEQPVGEYVAATIANLQDGELAKRINRALERSIRDLDESFLQTRQPGKATIGIKITIDCETEGHYTLATAIGTKSPTQKKESFELGAKGRILVEPSNVDMNPHQMTFTYSRGGNRQAALV